METASPVALVSTLQPVTEEWSSTCPGFQSKTPLFFVRFRSRRLFAPPEFPVFREVAGRDRDILGTSLYNWPGKVIPSCHSGLESFDQSKGKRGYLKPSKLCRLCDLARFQILLTSWPKMSPFGDAEELSSGPTSTFCGSDRLFVFSSVGYESFRRKIIPTLLSI